MGVNAFTVALAAVTAAVLLANQFLGDGWITRWAGSKSEVATETAKSPKLRGLPQGYTPPTDLADVIRALDLDKAAGSGSGPGPRSGSGPGTGAPVTQNNQIPAGIRALDSDRSWTGAPVSQNNPTLAGAIEAAWEAGSGASSLRPLVETAATTPAMKEAALSLARKPDLWTGNWVARIERT